LKFSLKPFLEKVGVQENCFRLKIRFKKKLRFAPKLRTQYCTGEATVTISDDTASKTMLTGIRPAGTSSPRQLGITHL